MKIDAKQVFSDPRYCVALGFGSGLSPKAPGTMGTLAAIPFFLLMQHLHPIAYVAIVLIALGAGILICDWVAEQMGIADPGMIVFDEFVGLWVALFMLPSAWYWLPVGVVLFRIFDIAKPPPVGWLDRNLHGGLGIMLDDVAAGIYALGCVQAGAWLVSRFLT